MDTRKVLYYFLSFILLISALFKLTSISYVSGILFTLLPTVWIDSIFAAHLGLFVILVCIIELAMAFLLWSRHQKKIIWILGTYLIIMLLFNGYQLQRGVADCSCFGQWLQIPPVASIGKTIFLLGCVGFLLFKQAIGKVHYLPIHQP